MDVEKRKHEIDKLFAKRDELIDDLNFGAGRIYIWMKLYRPEILVGAACFFAGLLLASIVAAI